jgi:hypothetical protein
MASIVPDLGLDVSLANLGQIWRQNQERQQMSEYLQQQGLPPNISLAQLAMGNKRDERDFAFRQEETRRAQGNSDRNYALQAKELELKREPNVLAQTNQRVQAAATQGLQPNSPAYQSYVLTGKMPREDAQPLTATDKKAILEADEAVLQNQSAIDALKQAKQISPQANTGYFASARGAMANALPDYALPDFVSSKESGAATANYDNLVLGQALASLKSIFGAAPTEGERKILIDLQASADKPDNVRQDILNRAQVLAEKRLEFNKQRAGELRGGEFYKPADKRGAAPQAAPQQQGAESWKNRETITAARQNPQATISEAMQAIQRGANADAVRQRLRAIGLDLPQGNTAAGAIY